MRFANKYTPFLLAIASALLLIPFLGRMHLFDWDEINFAECAREMIISKDYLNVTIHFRPFWEKPPLFIWMQVLSMKVFGIHEFAARFPNAVCGIFTLLILYKIGKQLFNREFGIWWSFIYIGSVLPHLYFRSGIIDPWFNLFIFLSLYFFILFSKEEDHRNTRIAWSGLFAGLAILTKGPVAVLILGLVVMVYYSGLFIAYIQRPASRYGILWPGYRHFLLFLLVVCITGGSWFLLQILTGNGPMVTKFIVYQVRLFIQPDAVHGGHWSYHFWVLLFGVFPASVFALRSLGISREENEEVRLFHRFMLILFGVVLILFSVVKTKIVHYSSLCYFPLTFLATYTVNRMLEGRITLSIGYRVLLLVMASVLAIVTLALPFVEHYKQIIIDSEMIKDDFALANLRADVHWTGFESLTGLMLLLGTIAGLWLLRRQFRKGLMVVFASSLLFTGSSILVFPYRIEQYSQRAAIEFYKSKAGTKCYILNSGFFTYAPDFYAERQPGDFPSPMWLLTGKIDRPFYLVLKEPHYREWKHLVPAMKKVYDKNGWIVLERLP